MKNAFLTFTGLILYRLSLDMAYPSISEFYSYLGMIRTTTAMQSFASWMIFLLTLPIVLKLFRRDYIFAQILYFSVMALAILKIPELKMHQRPVHC